MSITPFGRPVVPDEYGSTHKSFAGSIVTAGASASIASDERDGRPGTSSIVINSICRCDAVIACVALSTSAPTVNRIFTLPSLS